jgi:hypothetical protein
MMPEEAPPATRATGLLEALFSVYDVESSPIHDYVPSLGRNIAISVREFHEN